MRRIAPIGVVLALLALVGCGAATSTSTVTSDTTAAPMTTQAASTTTAAAQPPATQVVTSTTTAMRSVTVKWGEKWSNEKVEITIAAPEAFTGKDGKKGASVAITTKNLSQEALYYSRMVLELFDTLGSSSKNSFSSGAEPFDNEQPGKTMWGVAGFSLAEGAQPKSIVVSWPEILGDMQLIWQ